MPGVETYKFPSTGVERETLRAKGQFWTPDWVADMMVAYALQEKPDQLFDPAFGEGAFLRAAKRYAKTHQFNVSVWGRDIDPEVILQAKLTGVANDDLRNVELRDFVLDPPDDLFPAIVVNPPYIRHHRLAPRQKELLADFAYHAMGCRIDGRAGFHVYFLIRSLLTLAPGGRLAYIVSADICEGVFSTALWGWVCSHYKLDAVITFAETATPFPGVDTNALLFLIRNTKPSSEFDWIQCFEAHLKGMIEYLSGHIIHGNTEIEVYRRLLSEALVTGLSRPPEDENCNSQYTLGDFATVMRGIVTGDNDFFFMTLARARELKIPDSMLVKALGRTRDVLGENFNEEDVERLEANGRATRLLYMNGTPYDQLPCPVQKYLELGQKKGLPNKTLIKTRSPWYRMETRRIPPILFAYLGRRNTRFIRNLAGVVPLTCLLCVYPRQSSVAFTDALWKVLSNPLTVGNLKKVGKSYGGGAIKVEPRALERLPLPDELVFAAGLDSHAIMRQVAWICKDVPWG